MQTCLSQAQSLIFFLLNTIKKTPQTICEHLIRTQEEHTGHNKSKWGRTTQRLSRGWRLAPSRCSPEHSPSLEQVPHSRALVPLSMSPECQVWFLWSVQCKRVCLCRKEGLVLSTACSGLQVKSFLSSGAFSPHFSPIS